MLLQLRHRDGPAPRDEIASAALPVARHQDAVQFAADAPLFRMTTAPPGRAVSWREPFCDSNRYVSSASTMPFKGLGRSSLAIARKRWRQRKLVLRWMPVVSAAARTVIDPSMHCRKGSHLSRNRMKASGVSVSALKERRHWRQR